MVRQLPVIQELPLPNSPADSNLPAFSALYDRYAPALLGVITRIVADPDLAVDLLTTTFVKVNAELHTYRPEKQPLFSWLLAIARSTALDALMERKKALVPIIRLSSLGTVTTQTATPIEGPVSYSTKLTEPRLNELLDSVLFKNCTPEEAAETIGLPVETARQQLRTAMQQMRAAQQAR